MMMVTCAGRISKSAKLTKAGTSDVANFRLTVGRGDDMETLNCVLWGKRAVLLAEHLAHGVPVTVVGKLKRETHDGTRYLSVNVQEIDIGATVADLQANKQRAKAAKRQQAQGELSVVDGSPWGLDD